MERIKKLLGVGVPGGIDDIIVRSVKTGIAVFLAANPFASVDSGKAALFAGLSAAVTALGNAIILAVQKYLEKRAAK